MAVTAGSDLSLHEIGELADIEVPVIELDDVGRLDEPTQDAALPRGGLLEHGVQDDDRRHRQVRHDVDQVAAVGPAEDPVLVLDHDGADACGRPHGRRGWPR
jgi:hypothetical protein